MVRAGRMVTLSGAVSPYFFAKYSRIISLIIPLTDVRFCLAFFLNFSASSGDKKTLNRSVLALPFGANESPP